MILAIHLLAGALIVSTVKPLILAFILAYLSHYVLDSIPHWDYNLKIFRSFSKNNLLKDSPKIILDIILGIVFITLLPGKIHFNLFSGAFLAIIPDLITFIYKVKPLKLFRVERKIHETIHFPEEKVPNDIGFSLSLIVILILFLLPQ